MCICTGGGEQDTYSFEESEEGKKSQKCNHLRKAVQERIPTN